MKKRILRVILVIFLVFGILLGAGAVYVAMVLKEVPVLVTTDEETLRLWPVEDVNFQGGSFLNPSELQTFYVFSGEKNSWDQWLTEKIREGTLSKVPEGLLVEKDFSLKSLLFNDCSDLYCFQHRLSFNEMPSLYWKTLIAIEDFRYLDHFGVDVWSLLRAGVLDLIKLRMEQGGSTLTQQVVKNLFLNQEKTFSRKLKEMIYSIYLEMNYSKEEILEVYLNESYWGVVQGIKLKGVAAASLFYFGKKPNEITPYEASMLISLLKGPAFLHPVQGGNRLKDRSQAVYKKLIEQNVIDSNLDKPWSESDWGTYQTKFKNNDIDRLSNRVWRSMIHEGEHFNPYEDFVFQHKAFETMAMLKTKLPDRDIAIKALWGKPFSEGASFYRFYSKAEKNLAVAMEDERHPIGSTLKPLLYHFFVERGKKLSDEVETGELSLKLSSGVWAPREDHVLKVKKITLANALLESLNRPVVRVSQELGFQNIEEDLLKIIPERLNKPLAEFPAQLLGTVELSLKESFEMYKYFLTQECAGIVDGKRSIDDSILALMADPNLTTVKHVVKGVLKNQRFFGKTGTTNNGYDNWYVAYDGKWLGIIWVGLEGKREGKNLGLYGSTTAFQIYQGFVRDRGQRFNELGCDEYANSVKNL